MTHADDEEIYYPAHFLVAWFFGGLGACLWMWASNRARLGKKNVEWLRLGSVASLGLTSLTFYLLLDRGDPHEPTRSLTHLLRLTIYRDPMLVYWGVSLLAAVAGIVDSTVAHRTHAPLHGSRALNVASSFFLLNLVAAGVGFVLAHP